MLILKISDNKYVDIEKMTYFVRTGRKGEIRFAVGGGEFSPKLVLDQSETEYFLRWLDYFATKSRSTFPAGKESTA